MLGGANAQQPGQQGGQAQSGGLGGLLGGLAASLGGQQRQGGQGQGEQPGQAQSGGLGGLLGGLASSLGGQQGGQSGQQGGQSGGLGGLLGGLASSLGGGQSGQPGQAGAQSGGLAAGGLMGMLAGRSGGLGGLPKIGGVAAIGMLAHSALKQWQANQGQPNAVPDQPDLKKQLAAPAADGHIDQQEQQAIASQIEKMDLDEEGKAFIANALQNPPTASQIAELSNGPEQSAQLYLMARIAINPDEPSEQAFLKELAEGLGVPDELIAQLEQQITGAAA